jgi:CIC family chloride channel protein
MVPNERPDDTRDRGGAVGGTPTSGAGAEAGAGAGAVESSTTSVRVSADLAATGFYKRLPTAGRLARLWTTLGLLLGRRLAMVVRDDHLFIILMAAFVGVTSGAAAGLLLAWIEFAIASFSSVDDDAVALRWVVVVGVPVLGGLLAGAIRYAAERLGLPPANGVPAIIEAIARRGGTLRGRSGIVCGLGTGVTIASGGSCGHEGPSVAIGATVGSVLARFFGLRQRRRLAMVGAGCAGGLAAAFNAPLAGVIFTVEIVFGGAIGGDVGSMSVFVPLVVAAVCGTFTSYAIRGDAVVFDLPQHAAANVGDLGFYVLLALLAGLIGTAMSRTIILSANRFDAMRVAAWLKPAIGALGVGVLAVVVSQELMGAGHSTVTHALHGRLDLQLAAALLLVKIVATGLTLGSGGFGGAFMPSLFVGACLGTLVAGLADRALVDAQASGAYALVGMGAIFAATMHAPLTPIVMMFEMTHDYAIILPLMLSCILAVVVARRFGPDSLFKLDLQRRGVLLGRDAEAEVMRRGLVSELVLAPGAVLTESAQLEEIRRVCLGGEHDAVFVVDGDGAVVGYVERGDLARRLLAGELTDAAIARDVMTSRRMALLVATDTLAGAMLASARSGMEVLPVVDGDRRLIGVLRRGDLVAHYSDKVLGEREEVVQVRMGGGAVPDQEVGLGKGIILERVVIARGWAGRSLAELDLRGRTGVTVLEWCRGEQTMPIDPRAPLREADVLALAGTREQLLLTRAI